MQAPPLFDFDYDDHMPRFEAERWGFGPSRGTVVAALVCIGLAAGCVGLLAARDLLIGRAPASDIDGGRDEGTPLQARPPSRDQVERAYARVRQVFTARGVAGLAEEGTACFAELERRPDYGRLDFCLAFDAFAGGVHRIAGARGAPEAAAYFREAAVRHIRATDSIGAPRAEANVRVAAVGRLAAQVTRENADRAPIVIAPPAPDPAEATAEPPATATPPTAEETPYTVGPQPSAATASPPEPMAPPAGPEAAELPPG
jgi:hypothetical protein